MNYPLLLIDTWESGGEIDESIFLKNAVAGMIVRINDTIGGHHIDENFYVQWEQARVLPIRIVYFVYNPWKDAQGNYDWLIANLPAECGAVMVDVEVKYTGYPPATYGTEFFKFHLMLKAKLNVMIYTGEWFLEFLSTWPVSADYWWAAYPVGLYRYETITWDALRTRLEGYDRPSNEDNVPGTLKMWQFTGDRMILPGCDKRMDVSVYFGTMAELKAWVNEKPTAPVQIGDKLLNTREYFPGAIESKYETRTSRGTATYNVTEIETREVKEWFVTPMLDGRRYVPKFALLYQLDVAINLGGWTIDPKGTLTPTGYNASEGQPYGKNPNGEKIIYIDQRGKFTFDKPGLLWNAFSIQNELIVDGVIPYIDKALKDYRGRTAIGWNKDQTLVYLLTVDGGDQYSQSGLNFPETAEILLNLGCWYGFMCDTGGSSTMAVNDGGVIKVIGATSGEDTVNENWLVDPAGENHLRRVLNAIGVRMLAGSLPPPPPTGDKTMYKAVLDPTPRKTPSMYQTVTLAKMSPGTEFEIKATQKVVNPGKVDDGVTFVQVSGGYADNYWVPVDYQGKIWVKPVVVVPNPDPDPDQQVTDFSFTFKDVIYEAKNIPLTSRPVGSLPFADPKP